MQDTTSAPLNCSASFLMSVKMNSCSRQNFAVNLVRQLFTEDERRISNVAGKMNKHKMDVSRIAAVKASALQLYPVDVGETIEKAWASCIKSIDESNRRLNRCPKPPA